MSGSGTNTHVTGFRGRFKTGTSAPTDPVAGDMYYNTQTDALCRYSGNNWLCGRFTSTSTSTTTSTSTSTSTSTTSTSTSSSTSTSTSTSTTTTL